MKNNFGKKVTKLMKERNLSYRSLEDMTEIPKSALYRYINGETESIPVDRVKQIANALHVSPAYLSGWEDEPNESKFIPIDKVTEDIMIPVLGNVPCGQAYEAVENVIDHIAINQPMYDKGVRYALVADGDSMDPQIIDGDIMLIKPTPEVHNGAIAIVKINGFEATCKKIKIGTNTLTLVPYNSSHEVQVFTDEDVANEPVEIIGQVIQTRRDFD